MCYLSVIFGGIMGLLGYYLGDKMYNFIPQEKEIPIEELPIIEYNGCLYTVKEFEKFLKTS